MFDINDLFGEIFREPKVGDLVTAQLDSVTSVKGVLKALPTAVMSFCIVDGVITKNGVGAQNNMIVVPRNLLKLAVTK